MYNEKINKTKLNFLSGFVAVGVAADIYFTYMHN